MIIVWNIKIFGNRSSFECRAAFQIYSVSDAALFTNILFVV